MNQPSYHEELAAHLDGQAHPKPHPAPKQPLSRVPADLHRCCSGDCNQGRACPTSEREPGPITMHEPRTDWIVAVLVAMTVAAAIAGAVSMLGG